MDIIAGEAFGRLSGRVRKFSRRRQSLLEQLNSTVEEMISGYHTVVAYNHETVTVEEFRATADALTKAGIQTDIFSGVMHLVMQGRTSIVIAHRLSTIRDSDLIVVMDQGQIVESGTHGELLVRRGKYYPLYQTQYAGIVT